MLNLILALLWLSLGMALLVLQSTAEGQQGRTYLLGMVFALFMTGWNVLRWVLIRRVRARRRAARQLQAEVLTHRVPRPEPLAAPDPTFDFTRDPPPVRRPDGPASGV
jgi:hypothetical protein